VVVKPLGFLHHALFVEAEALGDSGAADVAGGATDFDSVQAIGDEAVGDHGAAGGGHDASAVMAGGEPVTDAGAAVSVIDAVETNRSGEMAVDTDHAGEGDASLIIAFGKRGEAGSVTEGIIGTDPREPLAETGAVLFDEGVKFRGMGGLDGTEVEVRTQRDYFEMVRRDSLHGPTPRRTRTGVEAWTGSLSSRFDCQTPPPRALTVWAGRRRPATSRMTSEVPRISAGERK